MLAIIFTVIASVPALWQFFPVSSMSSPVHSYASFVRVPLPLSLPSSSCQWLGMQHSSSHLAVRLQPKTVTVDQMCRSWSAYRGSYSSLSLQLQWLETRYVDSVTVMQLWHTALRSTQLWHSFSIKLQ